MTRPDKGDLAKRILAMAVQGDKIDDLGTIVGLPDVEKKLIGLKGVDRMSADKLPGPMGPVAYY